MRLRAEPTTAVAVVPSADVPGRDGGMEGHHPNLGAIY